MAQGLERVTLQALRLFQRVGPDADSSRSHSGMVCRSYPGSSAISATQDMSIWWSVSWAMVCSSVDAVRAFTAR